MGQCGKVLTGNRNGVTLGKKPDTAPPSRNEVKAPMSDMAAPDNPFKALEPIGNAPVSTATGIAAIALNLSIQYHDIATVQDGELYQQYKLEGRNMTPLHLDMVFETAIRMEAHLLGASDRIAKLVIDAISDGVERAEKQATEPEADAKSE